MWKKTPIMWMLMTEKVSHKTVARLPAQGWGWKIDYHQEMIGEGGAAVDN